MKASRKSIDPGRPDTVMRLARQIFEAFPEQVTGLKFYVLDCGCIYYQRVFEDGNLDSQVGIYRDAEDGPCDVCTMQAVNWKEMVRDVVVIYSSKFQVEGLG